VFELVTIRTAGDVRTQEVPARLAGKGLFTKEIEEALLAGEIDLAVHSLKDLPAVSPVGLAVGAVPTREDPRDVLIGCTVAALYHGRSERRIGTSSLRRKAQLLRAIPGCRVVNLRGNIDTRLEKTRDGTVDVAVLAAAGLHRLERAAAIGAYLDTELMLPAPGQGALALQVRAEDGALIALLTAVHCEATSRCTGAERAFMHALGGGCQLPVAALARLEGGTLVLRGRVLSLDGTQCLEGTRAGAPADGAGIGQALAAELTARGAGVLIADIERQLHEGYEA
jgi:hydroxymethylbilane synthase